MPKVRIDGQWVDVVGDHKLNSHTAPDGDIDVNSKKLINVAAPVNTTDAANKTYVDGRRLDQIAAPLANVSMNNNRLTLVPNPVSTGDAANKSYVDARITQGAWTNITLANGWVHHTSGYTPQAMIMPDQTVWLRGLVSSGTSNTIGTIPAACAPLTMTVRVPVMSRQAAGAYVAVQLDIRTNGSIAMFGDYGNSHVSLDGVSYRR